MSSLEDVVSLVLGERVLALRPIAGGDIADAYEAQLEGGRRAFVKTRTGAQAGMFGAEARGLEWLSEGQALRTPRVLGVSDGPHPLLALEMIRGSPKSPSFDEHLGRALAELHRFGAPRFGLDHDNFIGSLPQSNRSQPTWPDFYREERLEPQVRRAVDRGLIDDRLGNDLRRLLATLDTIAGPTEPPARLHGDLWGGNVITDENGLACLIDPAAYGGHREVDLAMMSLFGGFGPRVFSAYEERYPLSPGHEDRLPLYQLYPLLVHVNLFGRGYVPAAERAVRALV